MSIKKYPIGEIEPGMELAYPVVNETGQAILAEGTVLTSSFIERLKLTNVEFLDVIERTNDRAHAPILTAEAFDAVYDDTIQVIKSSFSTMRYFKEVPLTQMKELADTSINLLVDAVGVFSYLQIIRRQDDYTFRHSINVAIISGILGKWIGLLGKELKDLILTGLLHDIGKTQIPLEILNKPAKLTPEEMEMMKSHTVLGYKMLQEAQEVNEDILSGILQHHEKIDGSGYPMGISGEKTHVFAKVLAVADIYDAMTSDRVYHKKQTPFEVVEEINQEVFGKLDPAVCVTFLHNVRDYFIGTKIILSDGQEAEVVYQRKYLAARPTVCTRDGRFIDLERNKHISIVGMI